MESNEDIIPGFAKRHGQGPRPEMKEKLRQALAETRQREGELEDLCSDIPADPAGRWHPKDHLAHIAWHRDRNARLIEAVRTGGELPRDVDEDVNTSIYAATRDQPVAEVIAAARRSWDLLESVIEACTEEEWERPRPYGPPGRKLVDGSPGDHLAAHLMWCQLEAGNEKAAEAVLLWARDLSSRTSSDPRATRSGLTTWRASTRAPDRSPRRCRFSARASESLPTSRIGLTKTPTSTRFATSPGSSNCSERRPRSSAGPETWWAVAHITRTSS